MYEFGQFSSNGFFLNPYDSKTFGKISKPFPNFAIPYRLNFIIFLNVEKQI